MRAVIDQIVWELDQVEELREVTVEGFGPTYDFPDKYPYINVVPGPGSKPRERVFIIGASNRLYEAQPRVHIHVWAQDARSSRHAFEKCEAITEKVITALEAIDRTAFGSGIHYHRVTIEDFIDDYEGAYLYHAVLRWEAKMDETH